MNGRYILKEKTGTHYTLYWAPVTPELSFPNPSTEELERLWGLVTVDLDWICNDPRPKHLRAQPLPFELHAPYVVDRYPIVDGEFYTCEGALKRVRWFVNELHQGKAQPYYSWASG